MRILALVFIFLASSALADPVRYDLKADESRVGFTWFLGQDPVTGRMPVSRADMALDFDQVANSRVNVAVDVSRAEAGAPFAGEAMKGQSVLWADRFPEIVFRSTSIRRDGAGGAIIAGNLTVRGVTRPQVLTARLFRPAGAAPGDRRQLTIRLEGALSRRDFGADGFASFVGDRVELRILARIAAAS